MFPFFKLQIHDYYNKWPGYNEFRLYQTNLACPKLFVITKFDCSTTFIIFSTVLSNWFILSSVNAFSSFDHFSFIHFIIVWGFHYHSFDPSFMLSFPISLKSLFPSFLGLRFPTCLFNFNCNMFEANFVCSLWGKEKLKSLIKW